MEEEIITWLRETLVNKCFKLIEPEMIWYNSSHCTSVQIDNNDNLIIGRPTDNVYTVFDLNDTDITKESILEEINYYIRYYINKNFQNFKKL